jgi:hypothetical protein
LINNSYQFTATVSPEYATTPLNYTWAPAPASGQGTATPTYAWTTGGTKTISVTVSNAAGAASGQQSIGIQLKEGLEPGMVDSDGGVLEFVDANGNILRLTIPAGAVDEPVEIAYTPLDAPQHTLNAGMTFAGRAFILQALQNGAIIPGFTFNTPVGILLNFADSLEQDTLKLAYHNGTVWEEVAGPYTFGDVVLSASTRTLSAQVSATGEYALVTTGGTIQSEGMVYLPVIRK